VKRETWNTTGKRKQLSGTGQHNGRDIRSVCMRSGGKTLMQRRAGVYIRFVDVCENASVSFARSTLRKTKKKKKRAPSRTQKTRTPPSPKNAIRRRNATHPPQSLKAHSHRRRPRPPFFRHPYLHRHLRPTGHSRRALAASQASCLRWPCASPPQTGTVLCLCGGPLLCLRVVLCV
jgi:hypothetical protein